MAKAYHHGNLQINLIEEGLNLLYEQGIGNFSLRKLAKRVGVSPTACYNHYPNVNAILHEMKTYVTNKFVLALEEGAQNTQPEHSVIGMGKAYVIFFAKHPHYFSYLYDNEEYHINLTEDIFQSDFEPFCIFKKIAYQCMQFNKIPDDKYLHNLVVMWATVHGLAAMANMKGFHYVGDWGDLTETILLTKITLL